MARLSQVFPGAKFGWLKVIEISGAKIESGKKRLYCQCQCRCGKTIEIRVENLGRGKNESCGCLKKSRLAQWGERAHGLTHTRLHSIWAGMKQRCYNEKCKPYKDYGGRGIKVCDEWLNNFIAFYHWALISGYKENLTIDRIDPNGDYSPYNCQWITIQEQQAVGKKRENPLYKFIEHNGLRLSMKEWSLRLGTNGGLVCARIKKGWDPIKAITEPVKNTKPNRRIVI